MTFVPPLVAPLVAPLATPGGAVVPWYLLGGVTAAQCVAAYQPKGAADLAASYINLNNPGTLNASPGVAPNWDANNGWVFNGTTQWLIGGPSNYTSGGACTTIARFSNLAGTSGNPIFGLGFATLFYVIFPNEGNLNCTYYIGNSSKQSTGAITSGVVGMAGLACFKNGVNVGLNAGVPAAQTVAMAIGGSRRTSGAIGFLTACYIQAWVNYNVALSDSQMSAISAAMAAL